MQGNRRYVRKRNLAPEDLKRLLCYPKENNMQLAFIFAIAYGMRIREISQLCWKNVNFQWKALFWEDSHNKKYCEPIPDEIFGFLQEEFQKRNPAPEEFLIVNSQGQRVRFEILLHKCVKIMKECYKEQCGETIPHFHDIRRGCLTALMKYGNLKNYYKILGLSLSEDWGLLAFRCR